MNKNSCPCISCGRMTKAQNDIVILFQTAPPITIGYSYACDHCITAWNVITDNSPTLLWPNQEMKRKEPKPNNDDRFMQYVKTIVDQRKRLYGALCQLILATEGLKVDTEHMKNLSAIRHARVNAKNTIEDIGRELDGEIL